MTAENRGKDRGPAELSTRVADAIRDAITGGEFSPGQRLVEAELSERFGVSRAALRNAFVQLASEGLVERVQNRGARVRVVSLEEAVEITEVRMVVEGLCAAKAAERATEADRSALRESGRRMRDAVADGDVLAYSELNRQLHERILELSGQATAGAVLHRLRGQNVRHQFRLALRPGRPAVSLPEHLTIIDAVCAGDADAAEKAMRDHLRSVIEVLPEVDNAKAGYFPSM
ncbi:GntR family transcriptional regulator [Prauserella marina]|uniref:DNA-binding transcriptional regulator, GntR family n=1 Tax=Prauserella marina TaxID=530584 RepID=A0A222VTR4_9PSEU|nr:GntR family transcriptional regulator [Prauserella marina]ASR37222.1 GntR family transcriptional regulator [Prauserella marina]PWV72542.1 DNA-binding GntR family transcriptional regulator [Prauserella marina]SDD77596.1 DNA-binding transcriptional regulator, GntR family [Prauserella marina]